MRKIALGRATAGQVRKKITAAGYASPPCTNAVLSALITCSRPAREARRRPRLLSRLPAL
jgi:hypothetical protein